MPSARALIEICYEVCNKQGGVQQVIISKASAIANQKRTHIMIGPLVSPESQSRMLTPLCENSQWHSVLDHPLLQNTECIIGRWSEAPDAIVFLVNIKKSAQLNQTALLSRLKSYAYEYENCDLYVTNAIYFADAYLALIQSLLEIKLVIQPDILAHEWQAGAGVCHLRSKYPELEVMYQLHATQLGRILLFYPDKTLAQLNYDTLHKLHCTERWLKHLIEQSAIQKCSKLIALSKSQSDESLTLHGRAADYLVANGIHCRQKPKCALTKKQVASALVSLYSKHKIPHHKEIKIIYTAARHEHQCKGFDLFSLALAKLNTLLTYSNIHVIALIIAENKHIRSHQKARETKAPLPQEFGNVFLLNQSTWSLDNPLIKECVDYKLHKAKNLSLIYKPLFLSESDQELPIGYEQLLQSADLGVFLSRYEPWGYCPQECLAHGMPVVVSGNSGFVQYYEMTPAINHHGLLHTVDIQRDKNEVSNELAKQILNCLENPVMVKDSVIDEFREHFSWESLLKHCMPVQGDQTNI